MKLRTILQQEGLWPKTAGLRGDLYAEKNGRRKLWKRNLSDAQAAQLVEGWEEEFEEGSPSGPMSEGADAILVTKDGEYSYVDGWEKV